MSNKIFIKNSQLLPFMSTERSIMYRQLSCQVCLCKCLLTLRLKILMSWKRRNIIYEELLRHRNVHCKLLQNKGYRKNVTVCGNVLYFRSTLVNAKSFKVRPSSYFISRFILFIFLSQAISTFFYNVYTVHKLEK